MPQTADTVESRGSGKTVTNEEISDNGIFISPLYICAGNKTQQQIKEDHMSEK